MKTLKALLVCLLISTCGAAQQTDSIRYHQIIAVVQKAMNEKNVDAIYSRMAPAFRAKMTWPQFKAGMNKFHVTAGRWNNFSYKSRNDNGWDYIGNFELGQQLISLNLDTLGRISRLNFSEIPLKIKPKSFKVKTDNPLSSALDLQVETLVRPYIQKGNTAGLVLAVVKNGKTYTYNYGTTNKARAQLPNANTIFEIGSVTKTFTSLLLAQQVLSGKMKLDDPLGQYLPDSATQSVDGIKLVHLANHTSGFPRLPANIFNGNINAKNPYLHYNIDSLYSFLVHYKQTIKPGTVFNYSNYAAGLLGTILETQQKADFGSLVEQQITRPLGMPDTFVTLPDNKKQRFAQGYNEKGLPTSPWDLASLKGSGAIRSTLTDMVKYAKAQLGGKNALQHAIKLSHQSTFSGPGQRMALGWRIDTVKDHIYYHHSGGTGGFRSFVGFDKQQRVAVVILSNAADEVTEIGQRIILDNH